MLAQKHPNAFVVLLTFLLLLDLVHALGQTMPEPPAVLVPADAAAKEPEQSRISGTSDTPRCAYVPLFSKEAGMPGVEENAPERDNYGYIIVGENCD
jgi:hypothetical protein